MNSEAKFTGVIAFKNPQTALHFQLLVKKKRKSRKK